MALDAMLLVEPIADYATELAVPIADYAMEPAALTALLAT